MSANFSDDLLALPQSATVQHLVNVLLTQGQTSDIVRYFVANTGNGRCSPDGFIEKRIKFDYLVGAAEIAEGLSINRPHLIHDWRRRYPDFPEPIVELTGILLWDWRAVELWAQDSDRL